ncbi:ComEC/Rec2 family competence protein [Sulfurimonas sp.]|nr:ComEC/Rec2 family competence protein [Sulfurimonas sp.]
MIARVSLFTSKRDYLAFLFISASILFYSLLINYNEYKKLTRFDSHLLKAKVLKQYIKTSSKNGRTYQVLKLKSDDGLTFYTTAKKSLQDINSKKIDVEIWAGKISFYEYMTTFYANSKILHVENDLSVKSILNQHISSQHADKNISSLYYALYTAKPLHLDLQTTFSNLGISHLIAISGFHLGVLSALLFFLLRPLYRFFQNRYFPFRNANIDLFIIVSSVLLTYLLFLDSPPSLLRAFGMLVIGFILYDRGVEVLSMQTLFVTVVLLLSIFPKLFFTIGFWLSVAGVYYIFLFLIYYKNRSKIFQFTLLPIWVYIFMLPYSLVIFSNFSIYHPLSILWTTLFTLFYPLSIFLHVVSFGDLFDGVLSSLISLGEVGLHVELSYEFLVLHVALSLALLFIKRRA